MVKAAKKKANEPIKNWLRSIVNWMYIVASSGGDNADLKEEMWLSLHNHVTNKHKHPGKLFPKCTHAPLRGKERKKKWIKRRKSLC